MIKTVLTTALIIFSPLAAQAAGGGTPPPDTKFSFEGPFGTYDKAALQRGLQVYRNVCSACHGMRLLSYRNLSALGYSEAQIKAIAGEYTVMDGPNDEGEMFERPARPSDRMKSPYANEQQARYANGGAYPPDMSLMAKARKGGADYIAALVGPGYIDPPEKWLKEHTLLPGQYYNKYMAGYIIAMAPPLSEGIISYEDGSPETVEQYAKDVAHFLQWAAEPELESRKRMGVMSLLFILAFAVIMYQVKKKIWSDLKK